MNDVKALAFFDLDGTLLDGQSKITSEIAQAMSQLRKNNVMPIIATGRTNIEVEPVLAATGMNSAITMNGQRIVFDGKVIFDKTIAPETCERMLEMTEKKGHALGFYNSHMITVSSYSPLVKQAYDFIHADLPPINPEIYKTDPVNMLLVLTTEGDQEYADAFKELSFIRNGIYSIDVISADSSKGHGVKQLVKSLSFDHLPTYAFGDGMNDLDLFDACDEKIAMGNAVEPLKEKATYITAKNTEGGIVKALKHFDLL